MGIFAFFRNIFTSEPHRHFRRYKLVKPPIGNILEVDIGQYIGDSGLNDYERYYKVRRGKIKKKIVRRMKNGEDTYMFNTFELTPATNSSYILVIEKPLSNPPPIPTKVWKIILRKQQKGKKLKIIRVNK